MICKPDCLQTEKKNVFTTERQILGPTKNTRDPF